MQAAVANVRGDFVTAQKIVLLPEEEFRSFRGVDDEGAMVAVVANMRSVMTDREIAKVLGGVGIESPLMLIEAARIYDALVEGQLQ